MEFQGALSPLNNPGAVKKENESNQNIQLRNESISDREQKDLTDIQKKVNDYIEKHNLAGKLETNLTDEGLLLKIRDNVLFESGSAEVRAKDMKLVKEISGLLIMDRPRNIVIRGHTDNVPIATYQYGSNWDLSGLRAVNFLKILLENDKLDPKSISAEGFGEYKPVATNKTEAGRAKNRRIEVLIMPVTF